MLRSGVRRPTTAARPNFRDGGSERGHSAAPTSTMTSVEPGVIDTNVLVYAVDSSAPQHSASRALLDAARDPDTVLYLTSQILCEFYAVVTNARRVAVPRAPSDALSAISAILALPGIQ